MKPEKQLYQWDVNQYLTELQPTAEFVDYPIGNEVIRIKADGTRCRIPDEVLQTYGGKTCYERYPDGTYRAYSFSVLYAPKPPDYVYTPEERTTFEALTARVDASIEEIKRRADSGEFTPKKGVDYFTNAEKAEMMEGVSSGAVGEFRKVVDTATADYNRNAAEKLTTYDTNAEQRTSDYNSNAEQKLEAYNQNHTEKVAEYNQNAEIKKAEFDANVGEQIAEKANIDGYYEEMTVGDAEQLVATQFVEDNDPYLFRPTGGSSDVGNRAYLDKIVGGTVAWNQLEFPVTSEYWENSSTSQVEFSNGVATVTPTGAYGQLKNRIDTPINGINKNHKYLLSFYAKADNVINQLRIYTTDGYLSVVTQVEESLKKYGFIANGLNTSTIPNLRLQFQCNDVDYYDSFYISKVQLFDLTQMFGSTIADYIYSLEQSQAGAGVAWFKKLFPKDYYEYNAGELLSVEGLKSHDTVGFNQWDEEWEVGDISTSTGEDATATNRIRSKGFMPCLPNVQYCFTGSDGSLGTALLPFFYDADKQFISVGSWSNVQNVQATPQNCHYMRFKESATYGTTYNHDIRINLSSPSRNGEYEPYKKHSYPLDSSLTLRGIPKLDASNNLYYDGDEYTSDGKVKRKYGVVDLGNLNWGYQAIGTSTVAPYMYADVRSLGIKRIGYFSTMVHNIICPNYTTVARNPTAFVDKTICTDGDAKTVLQIQIKDSAYTDATAFKTAMSGVYLVYELATPTTEEADPFQHIQIVDDFGTEEFLSTGIVPVGHNTRYPANLRDKLQHLPSLASADGTYLIQQSGKQMSLIHMPAVFPEIPTDDGTYTLKTVVTGGVATLQWVAE